MKGRAWRRHHAERLKNTRYRLYRAIGWDYWLDIGGMANRLDDCWGPRMCSCDLCRNREPERRTREKRAWRRDAIEGAP